MKKPIIAQNALVTYNEELGQNTTDSYKIAKKFQMRYQNTKRNIEATIKVYNDLKSRYSTLSSEINSQLIENLDIEKEIISTKLKTDRGVIIDGYYLTEMGYTLALQHFSTPKLQKTKMLIANARLEFAQAFFLMRDIIQNQTPTIELDQKPIDNKNFGELSETGNQCARVKEVKGYWKSDPKDDFSILLGKRKKCFQLLGGMFDEEYITEIKLIDDLIAKIELTKRQTKRLDKLPALLA